MEEIDTRVPYPRLVAFTAIGFVVMAIGTLLGSFGGPPFVRFLSFAFIVLGLGTFFLAGIAFCVLWTVSAVRRRLGV